MTSTPSPAPSHLPAPTPAPDPSVWRTVGDPLVRADGDGPLAGLTVAVKDLVAVRGHRIGAGNPDFLAEGRAETAHAPAVEALLLGGASVRGIARTVEFAYNLTGVNPHYGTPPNAALPGALPGGSTSGSASAVAAGEAEVGLGTDTAGSLRVPASYQGLWGLRTTHGVVSREGVLPLAQSFDTVGWVTRDGATLERVARWCLPAGEDGAEPGEGGFAGRPLRLRVPAEALAAVAGPTRSAFDAWLAALVATPLVSAVDVVEVGDLAAAAELFRVVQAAEAWRNLGAWVQAHPGSVGPDVAGRLEVAATVTAEHEGAARAELARWRERARALVADALLVLPTAPGPAPGRSGSAADIDAVRVATLRLTTLAGVGGLPALSVPVLTVPSALGPAPVGVSLVGPAGSDVALVREARELQRAVASAVPPGPGPVPVP